MDNIPAYIRRKHGQEPVTYLHPLLEPYLEKTYGIFVYQEDIMSAAMALGGFTGPEADTLGYAIRKKKSSVLRSMREQFVTQAAERGVAPTVIDAVFKAFEPFERYGFNKAHATCYGLIAYQTAYLKANYTVEYMTSVLTAVRDNAEQVAAAIAECRRLGIEVRPPDVHRSGLEFTVEGDAIRFGLLAVKNVGQGAIESIVAAREADGTFRSLARLLLAHRHCGWRTARSSSRSPRSGRSTRSAIRRRSSTVSTTRWRSRRRRSATGSAARPRCSTWRSTSPGPREAAAERRRGAGAAPACVGEGTARALPVRPPARRPRGPMREFVNAYSTDLRDESLDGQRVVIGGVVTGTRTVITKSKQTMAVATVEDLTGSLEVIVFPRLYEQTAGTWQEGAILIVAGRIDHKGEETPLLADMAVPWEDAVARGPAAVAREIAAGDRGRGRRGNGAGAANGAATAATATPTATGTGPPRTVPAPPFATPAATLATPAPPAAPVRVSPLRAGAVSAATPCSPHRSRYAPTRSPLRPSPRPPISTRSPRCPKRPGAVPPRPGPRRRRRRPPGRGRSSTSTSAPRPASIGPSRRWRPSRPSSASAPARRPSTCT